MGESGLGKGRPHRGGLAGLHRTSAPWPSPHSRMTAASFAAASSFTVTRKVTSVTTLPLVESDLISVGKLAGCQGLTKWFLAANSGFGRALRRSFLGGLRIQ